MLKLLGFLVALCAVVLMVWLGIVALSPSYNQCVQKDGEHPTEHYTSYGQEIVERPIHNPTRVRLFLVCGSYFANRNGEAFTGVFTIALTIATFLLGFLAWDQGQTSRAQLRAYIEVHRVTLTRFSFTEPIKVSISFRNTGVTPARNAEGHGVTFFGPLPTPKWRSFPAPNENPETGQHSNTTIWPSGGAAPSVDAPPINMTFPANEMLLPAIQSEMLKGKPTMAIYVAGAMHYRDVFGRKRSTQFCQFVDPDDAKKAINIQTGKEAAPSGWRARFICAPVLNDFT